MSYTVEYKGFPYKDMAKIMGRKVNIKLARAPERPGPNEDSHIFEIHWI